MKRLRIGILGLVVSAAAIILIFTQNDIHQLGAALAAARYEYLPPAAGLLIVGLVCRALRWRLLLSGALPLRRAFSIMNVAYLVNNLLPLRIGEVARMFLATRVEPPVPILKTGSTIITERLLDLLAVVVLLALVLAIAPLPPDLQRAGLVSGLLALTGFGFLVFLAGRRELAIRLVVWLATKLPVLKRLQPDKRIVEILDGLAPLTNVSTLAQVFAWTAISWGFSITAGYILMFAFFPEGDWVATVLYIAAAAFITAVPAVPGNIGPYELTIIEALRAVSIGTDDSRLGFALVVHGVNLFVHVLTGVMGFIQEGISLGQLQQGVQEIQQHSGMVAQDGITQE